MQFGFKNWTGQQYEIEDVSGHYRAESRYIAYKEELLWKRTSA
jgi:hypothetical protein